MDLGFMGVDGHFRQGSVTTKVTAIRQVWIVVRPRVSPDISPKVGALVTLYLHLVLWPGICFALCRSRMCNNHVRLDLILSRSSKIALLASFGCQLFGILQHLSVSFFLLAE